MGKTYRNIGGSYQTREGVTIPSGAVFTSDDEDLCAKFVNAFQEIHPQAEVPVETAPAPAPVTPTVDETETEDETPAGLTTPDGHTDVTAEFPEAVERKMTVTKSKNGYWLYDGDPEPINEKGLKKKDVVDAIVEYLPED